MSLTIVGGSTLDVIFPNVPKLPTWPTHTEFTSRNLVLLGQPPILTLGGNGANAAYVAARCGAEVTLHTALGDDASGVLVHAWLEGAGCRVRTPGRSRPATPINVTAAGRRHQRATFFYPGSAPRMPGLGLFAGGHLLVCGWPHPALAEMTRGLAAARKQGVFTALDAGPILGPAWGRTTLRRIVAGLDLFLSNEHEIKALTRARDLSRALEILRRDFAGHVVIKRGGDGAFWLPEGKSEAVPVSAPAVRVVNTVGAGDSFNGALMASLAAGASFPKALRTACRVASKVVASGRGVVGMKPRLPLAP